MGAMSRLAAERASLLEQCGDLTEPIDMLEVRLVANRLSGARKCGYLSGMVVLEAVNEILRLRAIRRGL
jgi:hypothetical protein